MCWPDITSRRRALWRLVLWVPALLMVAPGVKAAEEEAKAPLPFPQLRLSLSVGATKFLLGEPIAVYVELTNPNRAPVLAHRAFSWRRQGGAGFGDGEHHLLLMLTRDSEVENFRPYGMPDTLSAPPRPALIEPGAVLRTKELLVGEGPFGRSIQSVGTVEIAARFRNTRTRWDELIASTPVRVTIVTPEGRDAEAIEVFKNLAGRHPKSSVAEDALYLAAESNRKMKKPVEADQTLRELLKRYPDTPAADDAQAALAEIAREPEMLFHEDRRLDAKISVPLGERVPLEEAVKRAGEASKVPLRVAPELRIRTISGKLENCELRKLMAELDDYKAAWVREPDAGYRLVPAANPP